MASTSGPSGSHPWLTAQLDELFLTIGSLSDREQTRRFFRDLCTLGELEAMAQRWEVARLVDEGVAYLEISKRTGASTATVTRVAHWLHHGEGGYRAALRGPATRSAATA
ncbi:MAG: YerC/YecD family TrpR-related protein [Candidatus Dormibacteria bacterium]